MKKGGRRRRKVGGKERRSVTDRGRKRARQVWRREREGVKGGGFDGGRKEEERRGH